MDNEENKFEDKEAKFEASDVRFESQEVYTPPSNLKIPKDIKEKFKSAGFYLKWVNRAKVRKRMHPSEGFVFAMASEFEPEELLSLGDTEESTESGSLVTNGDLVLMRCRIEKAEARREYYQNKTKSQAEAIERRLRENALDHGGSKSVVRTGKQAHFSSNF